MTSKTGAAGGNTRRSGAKTAKNANPLEYYPNPLKQSELNNYYVIVLSHQQLMDLKHFAEKR